ncbi:hypothetical protein M8J77_020979 [Diaphorina citri]|nr:hypothetical protein M8J77_020979 [Diaphorina citri]
MINNTKNNANTTTTTTTTNNNNNNNNNSRLYFYYLRFNAPSPVCPPPLLDMGSQGSSKPRRRKSNIPIQVSKNRPRRLATKKT